MPLDRGRGEGGVLESRGAEHDSPRPNGNRGFHVPGRSQAAADLAGNRRTHRSNDVSDERRLAGRSRSNPVEVDDVDPLDPGRSECPRRRNRILAIDRLPCEIALGKSYDPAGPQVDRRQELER